MRARPVPVGDGPDRRGVARFITERDGSLLPVVETAEPAAGETPEGKNPPIEWEGGPPVFGAGAGLGQSEVGGEQRGSRGGGSPMASGRDRGGSGKSDANSCLGERRVVDHRPSAAA